MTALQREANVTILRHLAALGYSAQETYTPDDDYVTLTYPFHGTITATPVENNAVRLTFDLYPAPNCRIATCTIIPDATSDQIWYEVRSTAKYATSVMAGLLAITATAPEYAASYTQEIGEPYKLTIGHHTIQGGDPLEEYRNLPLPILRALTAASHVFPLEDAKFAYTYRLLRHRLADVGTLTVLGDLVIIPAGDSQVIVRALYDSADQSVPVRIDVVNPDGERIYETTVETLAEIDGMIEAMPLPLKD